MELLHNTESGLVLSKPTKKVPQAVELISSWKPHVQISLNKLKIENDEKDAEMLYVQTMVVSRKTFKCKQTWEFGKGFCMVKAERTRSNHAKQKQQIKQTRC